MMLCIAIASATQAQTGCIRGNCTDGNGSYRFDNGDNYAGEWKGGNRTGYGRYDWSDGSYYVGYFKDNLLDGEGGYYATDGTKMVGYFIKNEYQGESQSTDVVDDKEDSDDIDIDKWLADMNESNTKDSIAQASAIKKSQKGDFSTTITKVIKDFSNNFDNLKGEKREQMMAFSDVWFSNIMVDGSLDAQVSGGLLTDNNTWYNTLYESLSFDNAKAKYDKYVADFNKMKTSCCTLVYDTTSYTGDSYSSYSTYWLTFLVNDGFDEETYKDMLIEIELSKKILQDGWEVIIRVSHESDNE